MAGFEIVDEHTLADADGARHDVLEAIAVLPWVKQLCPLMPHEYAHQSKADRLAYRVVEHMLKAANPDTYRAYFRGYQLPNRYWDAPDGQRYWLTKMMINRCWPDSVEPLRLVERRCQAGPRPGTVHRGPRMASASTSRTRRAAGGRPRLPSRLATSRAGRVAERGPSGDAGSVEGESDGRSAGPGDGG